MSIPKFKTVNTKVRIDNAIFTFGTYEEGNSLRYGYKVFCAGFKTNSVELFNPLSDIDLNRFIIELSQLSSVQYKKELSIENNWKKINLYFCGKKEGKGIKVRASLGGFLNFMFIGVGGFGSYIKEQDINRLIEGFKKCQCIEKAV